MMALTGLFGLLMAGMFADSLVRSEPDEDGEDDAPAGDEALDPPRGTAADFLAGDAEPAGGGGQPVSEWDLLLLDPWDDDSLEEVPPGTFDDGPNSTDAPPEIENLLLEGTDGDDLLIGGAGDDVLIGGGGNDLLSAGGGDDELIAGSGDNWLDGGDGDDLLRGGTGNDTLVGGAGDDTLIAGGGDNELFGQAGDDLLRAGSGNDLLSGGSGNDTLIGGAAGNDTLSGGYGDDLLIAGAEGSTVFGGDGADTLVGAIHGRDAPSGSFLNGGAGDDVLLIGPGDIAHGGAGADSFVLGDWMTGNAIATIQDFDPDTDRLVIALDPETRPDPSITLVPDADDPDAVRLLLDGVELALVQGGAGLTVDDIELVAAGTGHDLPDI